MEASTLSMLKVENLISSFSVSVLMVANVKVFSPFKT